jgi:hypothetical protein
MISNNSYIFLEHLNKYGLVKSKLSDSLLLVRIKSGVDSDNTPIYQEVEIDLEKDRIL